MRVRPSGAGARGSVRPMCFPMLVRVRPSGAEAGGAVHTLSRTGRHQALVAAGVARPRRTVAAMPDPSMASPLTVNHSMLNATNVAGTPSPLPRPRVMFGSPLGARRRTAGPWSSRRRCSLEHRSSSADPIHGPPVQAMIQAILSLCTLLRPKSVHNDKIAPIFSGSWRSSKRATVRGDTYGYPTGALGVNVLGPGAMLSPLPLPLPLLRRGGTANGGSGRHGGGRQPGPGPRGDVPAPRRPIVDHGIVGAGLDGARAPPGGVHGVQPCYGRIGYGYVCRLPEGLPAA